MVVTWRMEEPNGTSLPHGSHSDPDMMLLQHKETASHDSLIWQLIFMGREGGRGSKGFPKGLSRSCGATTGQDIPCH